MSDLQQATPDAARRLTDQIKVAIEGTWLLIQEAYLTRTWAALDYDSWDVYCSEEFGTSRLRLPREERQGVVASLRESGLSTRAIASATGLNQSTIVRDLGAGDAKASPQQAPIKGVDGKSYQAARPMPSPPSRITVTDARPNADEQPSAPRTVTVIHEPDLLSGDDWIEPGLSDDAHAPTTPDQRPAEPEDLGDAGTTPTPIRPPVEESPASVAAAAMRDAKNAPSHVFDAKAITHLRDAKEIVGMKGGSVAIIADLYEAGVNPDLTMRTWLKALDDTVEWVESFRADIAAHLRAPLRSVR